MLMTVLYKHKHLERVKVRINICDKCICLLKRRYYKSFGGKFDSKEVIFVVVNTLSNVILDKELAYTMSD